jgi:catechol 2,3-dioxygenase-like lactoylglutathione lyase family enzyme
MNSIQAGEFKLEVVVVPVADVDRAKAFYEGLGWRLDADVTADGDLHLVQFTPPGSGCSIQFGANLTSAAPGSAESVYLSVSDIEAAREDLLARGVEVSEVFHERPLPRPRTSARAGARPRHLRIVRDLQRSGWQQLAAPGDHGAAAGPLRGAV